MEKDIKGIISVFVDLLMPDLAPYEAVLYIFLLRNSLIKDNSLTMRIGKRTIASNLVKSTRGNEPAFHQIAKVLKELERKGCIKIGDVTRDGTLYTILLPEEIPLVKEKLAIEQEADKEDYFTNPEKRHEIFERDKWTCFYCGEKINVENATLDHLIPQSKGGQHSKENLKASCLICNSIKSGKTYEEAAPYLLRSIQERRKKQEEHDPITIQS